MYSHLLVPVDGTVLSERAVKSSLELARKLQAKVTGFVAGTPQVLVGPDEKIDGSNEDGEDDQSE